MDAHLILLPCVHGIMPEYLRRSPCMPGLAAVESDDTFTREFPLCATFGKKTRGFAPVRCAIKGIKAATQDYIIIIDGDMILDSHFIADHLRFAKRGVVLQGSKDSVKGSEYRKRL